MMTTHGRSSIYTFFYRFPLNINNKHRVVRSLCPYTPIAHFSFSAYGFYVTEYPELNYDTISIYNLTVECVENSYPNVATSAGTIRVYITENQPPSLTNLDGMYKHVLSFFSPRFVKTQKDAYYFIMEYFLK